jgi:hypothetical protein
MMVSREKSDQSAYLKTELSTKENGSLRKTKRIEEVFRYGQMEADTTASGETAWLMDKED